MFLLVCAFMVAFLWAPVIWSFVYAKRKKVTDKAKFALASGALIWGFTVIFGGSITLSMSIIFDYYIAPQCDLVQSDFGCDLVAIRKNIFSVITLFFMLFVAIKVPNKLIKINLAIAHNKSHHSQP